MKFIKQFEEMFYSKHNPLEYDAEEELDIIEQESEDFMDFMSNIINELSKKHLEKKEWLHILHKVQKFAQNHPEVQDGGKYRTEWFNKLLKPLFNAKPKDLKL